MDALEISWMQKGESGDKKEKIEEKSNYDVEKLKHEKYLAKMKQEEEDYANEKDLTFKVEREEKKKLWIPQTVEELGMGRQIPAVVESEGAAYARTYKANKCLVDNGDEPGQIWLTPNTEKGWFQLDLSENQHVSGFAFRNTQNGRMKDRWTVDFVIEASSDKMTWKEAAKGTFKQNTLPDGTKTSANLDLMYAHSSVTSMRYVKFKIIEYGGRSGGLSFFTAVTNVPLKKPDPEPEPMETGSAFIDFDSLPTGDNKKKKKGKKDKKKSKKKGKESSSSGSGGTSSSSGNKKKAAVPVIPAVIPGNPVIKRPWEDAAAEAEKKMKASETAAAALTPAENEAVKDAKEQADLEAFTKVFDALEKRDLTVLDVAVRLLSAGALEHKGAIAGALARVTPGSVDATGANRVAVAKAGAIKPLIQLLKTKEDVEVQRQAAWALHNLTSKNNENKETVIKQGGAGPVVAVLRSSNDEARAQAVGVLRNLSGGGPACKATVVAANAIPTVVKLMTNEAAPTVLVNLCVILFNLCKDSSERRVAVVGAAGLPALVSLLGSGIPQVQQEAADALRITVLDNRDHCSAAISVGLAPVLMVAMGATQPPKLQAQAGMLKRELLKSGGDKVIKALK